MLVIVGCGKKKNEASIAPARDRYDGNLYRQQLRVAEATGATVMILSGRYGLVPCDRMLPIYEHSKGDANKREWAEWGERVAREVERRTRPGERVYVLAGERYTGWIGLVEGREVVAPWEGLSQGERLAAAKRALEHGLDADEAPVQPTGDPDVDPHLRLDFSIPHDGDAESLASAWARLEDDDGDRYFELEGWEIGARGDGEKIAPIWCRVGEGELDYITDGIPDLTDPYRGCPWSQIPPLVRRWGIAGVVVGTSSVFAVYRNDRHRQGCDNFELLRDANQLARKGLPEPLDPEVREWAARYLEAAAKRLRAGSQQISPRDRGGEELTIGSRVEVVTFCGNGTGQFGDVVEIGERPWVRGGWPVAVQLDAGHISHVGDHQLRIAGEARRVLLEQRGLVTT